MQCLLCTSIQNPLKKNLPGMISSKQAGIKLHTTRYCNAKAGRKKLLDNPENSGIDLNGGLIFFMQKNAGTDGEDGIGREC